MLPKRLGRESVYESAWINLYIDRVLMPSGKIIEKYHQLDYPNDSITVLLLNSRNEICFIKSLRYTTQRIEWELPAGGVERGEDVLIAARREVLEETGFQAREISLVFSYHPSNGMSNQRVHVLFARVDADGQDFYDEDEVEGVYWFAVDRVKELIENNEITDGISLMPLLLFFGGIIHFDSKRGSE